MPAARGYVSAIDAETFRTIDHATGAMIFCEHTASTAAAHLLERYGARVTVRPYYGRA